MNPLPSLQSRPLGDPRAFRTMSGPQVGDLMEKHKIHKSALPILTSGLQVHLEKLLDGLVRVSRESETFEDFRANRFFRNAGRDASNVD